jgi:hypothetical protein
MRYLAMVVVVGIVLCSGCGVILNSEYSTLLDQSAALSIETAKRADAGALSQPEMVAALKYQANTWTLFQGGRDGKVVTVPFVGAPLAPAVLAVPTNTVATTPPK